jgi:hypothetical protein
MVLARAGSSMGAQVAITSLGFVGVGGCRASIGRPRVSVQTVRPAGQLIDQRTQGDL